MSTEASLKIQINAVNRISIHCTDLQNLDFALSQDNCLNLTLPETPSPINHLSQKNIPFKMFRKEMVNFIFYPECPS